MLQLNLPSRNLSEGGTHTAHIGHQLAGQSNFCMSMPAACRKAATTVTKVLLQCMPALLMVNDLQYIVVVLTKVGNT
jgi:hypothetical protein